MATLHQLRCFLSVLEHGSFTAAAETLGYSQPSISEQVRALERSYGVGLFTRVGRGVVPTPAGETLRPHAELTLGAAEQARRAVRAVDTLESGGTEGLQVIPVAREEPVYVPLDPARTARPVTALDLAQAPLVMPETTWRADDPVRALLRRMVLEAGINPQTRIEAEDVETAGRPLCSPPGSHSQPVQSPASDSTSSIPSPAARRAALEHTSYGVVVADANGAVIEANPAAVRILGRSIAELRGRQIGDLLPPAASVRAELGETDRFEIYLRAGDAIRHYVVDRSGLTDATGRAVGQLFLFHDLTEQVETQGRLMENRQAVARLTEREQLARDLHDSIGQVLGFVSMQAQAVQKRLADGDAERADAMLARLAEVAQQAHGDVRGLILALKSPVSADLTWSLDARLADQLRDFQSNYGIGTDLAIGDGVRDASLDAATGVQVLRVVQEALTNARRHGGADTVRVAVERCEERVRLVVEDDGRGYDRDAVEIDPARQFGLANMRERMEDVGGTLRVESSPGRGTRVMIEVPTTMQQEGVT